MRRASSSSWRCLGPGPRFHAPPVRLYNAPRKPPTGLGFCSLTNKPGELMKSGMGASAIVSATVGRLRRKEGVSAGASDGGTAASAATSPELEAEEGSAALGAAGGLAGAEVAEEGDTGAAGEASGARDGFVASAAAAASAQELRRVTGFPASFGLEGGVTAGMIPVQAS